MEGRAILCAFKDSPNCRLQKPDCLAREIIKHEIHKSLSACDNGNLSKFIWVHILSLNNIILNN